MFVASLEINDHCADADKICKYCIPSHRTEILAQKLKHSQGFNLFLSNDQREIVDMTHEFCKENNLDMEVVDIANLNFLDKMKLTLKNIRAPSILFEGKVIKGIPTKEKLKTLTASGS